MNREQNERDCGCLSDILRTIILLQKEDCDNESHTGCDKPFLGPTCTCVCYNTRPIMLFNCCTGEPWSFTFTLNGTTGTSNVFRVESLDECCCTCRILAPGTDANTFVATTEFFTINLDCVGAIRCLPDTFVEIC